MATNQFKWLVTPLDSEATEKPQPSKTMNGGSNKIDWANPESPSTIPGVRRADYQNFISKLNNNQKKLLWDAAMKYKNSGLTADQILEKVLPNIQWNWGSVIDIKTPDTTKNTPTDLTIKGNFDLYNPVDWQNQPEIMQQYFAQANNDLKASTRALSKLMLQQDALGAKSSNVNQVTTLIDAVENAYDRWVFDTKTIAKTLGVDENVISLIQQGKANELVTLKEDYVQDQLKSYYRAEEDYDTNMARTMEDYQLAKTNLDQKYNSAMQTLKRNLFDDRRAASVGSAVAWISGSEYAVRSIEAKHQQSLDDLESNYIYSDMTQKYSYTRAIEDYNTNITRLSEDFDDALKNIQAGILQQFQEIDNKIGLTTEQLAKAYWTLQQNVATAKSTAVTNFLSALSNNEDNLAKAIAGIYGIDTSTFDEAETAGWIKYKPVSPGTVNGWLNTYIESIQNKISKDWKTKWGVIRQWWCGEPVNDYLKSLWIDYQYWDSKASKINSITPNAGPKVWSIAIWDKTWTPDGDKYWHVAIVTWIDEKKGTITVLESNKNTWLRYHTYKMSNVTGYFDPSAGYWQGLATETPTEETATPTWYKEWYEADYRNYLTNGSKWFNATAVKTLTNTFGSWENFVASAENYKPELKKEDLSVIQWWLDRVNDIINEYNAATKDMSDLMIKEAVIAFSDEGSQKQALMANAYPELYTVYRRFQQYIAQWFIDTIIDSKKSWASYWQLSDNEWSKLTAAFTPAAMSMDKSEFLRVMWEAKTDLEQNVKEIKKAIKKSEQKPDTTAWWFSFWNIITWITSYFDALKEISKWEDIHFEDNVFTGSSEFDVNPFGTGSMFWTWEKPEWNWTGGRTTSMQ